MTQWYIFHDLTDQEVLDIQNSLLEIGEKFAMNGLILLAKEGCNGTVAGSAEAIETIKLYLSNKLPITNFQHWTSDIQPFKRFKVSVRNEIVALKAPTPSGRERERNHLSPSEFHAMLEKGEATVLDTRNKYETNIGTFQNAVIPPLKSFHEFPEYIQQSNIPKDKPVLMFCTSGIRCEKASEEMKSQGYEKVFQLDGGITKYLEEYPNGYWNGECFVFDHRVAVDNALQPSTRYGLCPPCGNPGDITSACVQCNMESKFCADCLQKAPATCSRKCRSEFKYRVKL